jgi:hypothetical protein
MKKKRDMTQTELNALTDKSLDAYIKYGDGSKYYIRPENKKYFQRHELRLVIGDDIKISNGEKNMLILEDYNGVYKSKIVIRKDQIR